MSTRPLSLKNLRGVTSTEAKALKSVGISNTAQLLAAAPDRSHEHAVAKKAGLTDAEVREAVNRADLVRVNGIGSATADLFENAGVNSVAELSHRNAASLEATLRSYAQAHASDHLQVPNTTTVAALIRGAQALVAPPPANVSQSEARNVASDALNHYIDDVLFSDDPAGASFRSNVLDGQPQDMQDKIRAELHAAVPSMLGAAPATSNSSFEEVDDGGDHYTFVGELDGLHTEVDVSKAGVAGRILVEID